MAAPFDAARERKIEQLFERHLTAGLHYGAQLAVYADGERVVDLAGGETGPDGEPTTPDRPHVLFSCTKPYAGVALHQLIEAGDADYDDRVVEHWPEFAADGSEKAAVTIRHVLSHQAGLPASPVDEQPGIWGDWDEIVAGIEDTELTTAPGSTPAYHALTFGWLVGELVRRLSGRPIDEYLEDEVFGPLGMDDTTLGTDEPEAVATLAGYEPFDRCRDPDEGTETTPTEAAAGFNEPVVKGAVVPAATGVGTARDMARFYASLANDGELDGTRLLDPETVERLATVQAETADDGTLSRPMRYGLGVWVGGAVEDSFGTLSTAATVGHLGLGSIVGWADRERDLAFAYVTNGIREESYEHWARCNVVADAVREIYG